MFCANFEIVEQSVVYRPIVIVPWGSYMVFLHSSHDLPVCCDVVTKEDYLYCTRSSMCICIPMMYIHAKPHLCTLTNTVLLLNEAWVLSISKFLLSPSTREKCSLPKDCLLVAVHLLFGSDGLGEVSLVDFLPLVLHAVKGGEIALTKG